MGCRDCFRLRREETTYCFFHFCCDDFFFGVVFSYEHLLLLTPGTLAKFVLPGDQHDFVEVVGCLNHSVEVIFELLCLGSYLFFCSTDLVNSGRAKKRLGDETECGVRMKEESQKKTNHLRLRPVALFSNIVSLFPCLGGGEKEEKKASLLTFY